MSRGPDAATQLERVLPRLLAATGVAARIVESDWVRWASVTFTGARHRMTLACPDTAAARQWLAALPDCEIPLSGHLVADAEVVTQRANETGLSVELELLTVEAR